MVQPHQAPVPVGRMRAVEFLHPRGQVRQVIGAADEDAALDVEPVGGVGHVAGRQDGGAVFQGHPDHARFAAIRHFQLIAHGIDQQAARRSPLSARASQQLGRLVRNAGDVGVFFLVVPLVAHNAAQGRQCAAEKRAMAHGRHGGKVNVPRIGKDRSPGEKRLEPAGEFASKARQVIVAELVQDQGQNQLRFLGRGAKQANRGQRAQQEFTHLGSSRVSPGLAAAML